jgi:hypothetical protein
MESFVKNTIKDSVITMCTGLARLCWTIGNVASADGIKPHAIDTESIQNLGTLKIML